MKIQIQKIKQSIQSGHFILIGLIVFNLVSEALFGLSFNYYIHYFLKGLIWLSGIILFFFYIKPFQKIAWYFLCYILPFVISIIGFIIDRIGGVIVVAFFVFFMNINLDAIEYQNNDFIIYRKFEGFLGMEPNNYTYKINGKMFFMFERKIGTIKCQRINFQKSMFKIENRKFELKFDKNSDEIFIPDTIIDIKYR